VFLCILPMVKHNYVPVLASAFGWFGLASVVLYIVQRKGWEYQLLPFFLSIATSFFVLFLHVFKQQPVPIVRLRVTSLLALLFSLSSLIPFLFQAGSRIFTSIPFEFPSSRYSAVITALTKPEERVLFFDSSVIPAFPALTYTGRQYGGRFLCAYPLAFIFHESSNYEVPHNWQKEENTIYEMFIEDVTHLHPRLVFIRAVPGGQALPAYFKVSQYLKQRGFYDAALGTYVLLGYVGPFEVHLLPSTDEKLPERDERSLLREAIQSLKERNVLRPYP